MSFIKTQIGKITYNPAREAFEALVSFHEGVTLTRVPASFRAPLTAEFDTISNGLFQSALRNRTGHNAIYARRPFFEEFVEPRAAA